MVDSDAEEIFDVNDAGIVDENVDCAEKTEGSLPGEAGLLDRAEIRLDAQAAASLAFYNPPRVVKAGGIAAGEDEISSRSGKNSGDLRPEPA
jgi:hypothetical protein